MASILPEVAPDATLDTALDAAPSPHTPMLMNALPKFLQTCVLCGIDTADAVCPGCNGDLPHLGEGCPQCAEETPRGETCGRCLQSPPAFAQAYALFAYDFPIDQMVHQLKYGHQLIIAHWFGQQLARRFGSLQADVIIPLPLHPDKLRERGFNQALEIARPLASTLGLKPLVDICLRTRATHTQTDLPVKERPANVRNAFYCTTRLDGQHVLLVDDVMTTGATLNECAQSLKQQGASQVTAIVVGRTLKHG